MQQLPSSGSPRSRSREWRSGCARWSGNSSGQAASDAYRDAVGLLRCFHGVDAVTALTVLAEFGDITRFGSAGQLMAYLGLTPSEHSSWARQRRGPITKTGNTHMRRLLVESAWH